MREASLWWLPLLLLALSAGLPADELDQYRYQPETEVIEENPLEGQEREEFECLDANADGVLSVGELERERRESCLGRERLSEIDLDTRSAILIERLDADRDREVTPREYKTWTGIRQ